MNAASVAAESSILDDPSEISKFHRNLPTLSRTITHRTMLPTLRFPAILLRERISVVIVDTDDDAPLIFSLPFFYLFVIRDRTTEMTRWKSFGCRVSACVFTCSKRDEWKNDKHSRSSYVDYVNYSGNTPLDLSNVLSAEKWKKTKRGVGFYRDISLHV